jgi:hypothetical protein
MSEYQLYLLSDDDRDLAREVHTCIDDHAAILVGRSLCFDHNIDIWHEARRVARIEKGDFSIGFRPRKLKNDPPFLHK